MEDVSRSSQLRLIPGLQERSLFKLIKRLPKLLLRVHDDGAVPGYRLFEWLSRYQKEPDSIVAGLHCELITAIEEYKRAVVSLRRRRGVSPSDCFGRHGEGTGCVAEFPSSGEHVSERVAGCFDGGSLPASGRHRYIEVGRVGGDPIDRAGGPPKISTDDAYLDAVVVLDRRNSCRFHFLVAR